MHFILKHTFKLWGIWPVICNFFHICIYTIIFLKNIYYLMYRFLCLYEVSNSITLTRGSKKATNL